MQLLERVWKRGKPMIYKELISYALHIYPTSVSLGAGDPWTKATKMSVIWLVAFGLQGAWASGRPATKDVNKSRVHSKESTKNTTTNLSLQSKGKWKEVTTMECTLRATKPEMASWDSWYGDNLNKSIWLGLGGVVARLLARFLVAHYSSWAHAASHAILDSSVTAPTLITPLTLTQRLSLLFTLHFVAKPQRVTLSNFLQARVLRDTEVATSTPLSWVGVNPLLRQCHCDKCIPFQSWTFTLFFPSLKWK